MMYHNTYTIQNMVIVGLLYKIPFWQC